MMVLKTVLTNHWLAGLTVLAVALPSRAELVYIDPHGVQTKLNGFSAGEVGYNVTRTRVVSVMTLLLHTIQRTLCLSGPGRYIEVAATSRLSMNQFNLAISKQTRTAVGMEAKLTYRVRGMVSQPIRSSITLT